MNNNFPCICGHTVDLHPAIDNAYICCKGCVPSPRNSRDTVFLFGSFCNNFKLDNLKYLEIKSEEAMCNE